jgi:hypothetical protein
VIEEFTMLRRCLLILFILSQTTLWAQPQVSPVWGEYYPGDSSKLTLMWKADTLHNYELEAVTHKGKPVAFIQGSATGAYIPFQSPNKAGHFLDDYFLKWKGINQTRKTIHDYWVMTNTTIRFDTTFLDMGQVFAGEYLTARWIFTNIGGQNLKIENVKPSCGGCVMPVWHKQEILPGSCDSIEAGFNTSGRVGKVVKTVAVRYNSRENPVVILTFCCEIIPVPFKSTGIMEAPSADEKH